MSSTPKISSDFDQQDSLDTIDAVRGYAILLVMMAHTTPHVVELVWPAKRLLLLGVYGVQLFFIASAVTLLMSWRRMRGSFRDRCKNFILRRIFRIAPLYFLAIPVYWYVYSVPIEDFSLFRLLGTLFFVNAWTPYLIPTVPGWMPVPGGWSISVEFCFYLIFPLLALAVTTLRRSLLFLLASVILMYTASALGAHLYPEILQEERENFLYFWPLNHVAIFALGFLLYHLLHGNCDSFALGVARLRERVVFVLVMGVFIIFSFYGQRKFFDLDQFQIPTHFLLSAFFLIWVYRLILSRDRVFVNRFIVALGKVSFSAYILHFLVLVYASKVIQSLWLFEVRGLYSVGYAFVLLATALLLTYTLASLTYRYIELPFIRLGKSLTT